MSDGAREDLPTSFTAVANSSRQIASWLVLVAARYCSVSCSAA
jgi:hypothetical protein